VTNSSTATYANIDANVSSTSSNGCYYFSSKTTSGGVTYYATSGTETYCYYCGVFTKCSKLKYVNIQDGVESLGYGAFFANGNVKSVVFPQNSVTFETECSYSTKSSSTKYYYAPTFGIMNGLERYYCSKDYPVTLGFGTQIIYDYNDGNLLYKLKDDDTYEVVYAFPNNATISIPNTVNDIKVTSIADYAFVSDEDLTTLTIPSTVTSIGANAFEGLTDLSAVMIPSSVTSIGDYAFKGCTSLSEVRVLSAKGVSTDIGKYAFADCTALSTLSISSLDTACVTIGDYAFTNCTSLSSMAFTTYVESVGDYCFYNSGVKSVTIPSGMTKIGTSAFSGCSNLATINVSSENVWFAAEDNVLFDDTKTRLISYPAGKSDESYIIPETVRNIDSKAFAKSKATYITISENTVNIGDGAFTTDNTAKFITCTQDATAADTSIYPTGSAIITLDTNYNNKTFTVTDVLSAANLTSYAIPKQYYGYVCTEIGDSAFSTCSALASVTIPNSVKTIGLEAFMSCTSLTSIEIPNGVESIGGTCLAGCTSLSAISIPPSVTEIGDGSFFNCPAMTVMCAQGSTADDESLYPSGSTIEYTIFVTKGDINSDGKINAADAVLALRYSLNAITLDETQLKAGDVNGDGTVDATDADLIVKYDTGEIATF
jgi:hypothetical protein